MATVQVVVVDEDGNPLVGVTVAAYSLENFPEIVARAVTDNAGSVRLTSDGPCFYDAFDRRGVSFRDRNYAGKVQIQIVSFSNYMNADYVVDASGFGTHTTLFGATGALQAAMASGGSAYIWLCTSHTETVSAQEVLPDFAVDQQIIIASGTRERAEISVALASTTPLIQMPFPGGVSGTSMSFKSFRFKRTAGTGALIGPEAGGPTLPDIEFENMEFKNGGSTFDALVGGSLLTAFTSGNLTVRGCTGNGVLVIQQMGATSNGLGTFRMDSCTMTLNGINRQSSSTSVDWGSSGGGQIIRNNIITHSTAKLYQQNYTGPIFHFSNNVVYSSFAGVCLHTGVAQSGSNIHITDNTYQASAVGAQFYLCASGTSNITNVLCIGNTLDGPGSGTAISTVLVNTGAPPESIWFWPNTYRDWTTNFDGTAGGATDDVLDPNSDGTPAMAPDTADYLIGTANADLPSAIVVGTTPGGELGGTWASPTVDATHSGSPHHIRTHNLLASADHLDTTTGTVSAGSIIRGNAGATAWEELIAATDGWVLTLVSGLPEWVTPGSSGGGGGMVTMHADTEQVEWTNQPAALTELFGLTNHRTKVDLTNASNVRLVARVLTAGAVGSELRAQYSTDEVTWNYLDGGTGPTVPLDGTAPATVASAVVNLDAGAQADVFLRVVGIDGDAATDPAIALVVLMFDTVGGGGTVAPLDAHYITNRAESGLTAEIVRQFLGNYYNETYPGSANAMDDEFDDTTGMSGTINGLNARWTWRNQSTSTTTFTNAGWLTMNVPSSGTDNFRIIEQTFPGGDWTIEAKISYEGAHTASAQAGLVLVDNTNGDLYFFGPHDDGGTGTGNGIRLFVGRYTNVTTFSASMLAVTGSQWSTTYFLRIVYHSGANTFDFWYSTDGIGWVRLLAGTANIGADRVGLAVDEVNTTALTKLHCDYFRRTA